MSVATNHTLDSLVTRVGQLHSPPAVALEIVRLTSEPTIDAAAIRECLEGDPALTAKLLRVVNSALYGLPEEVADLTQAIALVGVRPLKLLVLGFSTPPTLLDRLDADALRDYWTRTIVRAIGAQQIASTVGREAGWEKIADEALVVGLLEGIGQLALICELSETYTSVLAGVWETPTRDATLADAEREALGFDHRELSAAMLRSWNLPPRLADAIESQATGSITGGQLGRVLTLADLTTSLVVNRELAALPKLLDLGERYCGLTRRQVNTLVEDLQPRANQLATALGVDLAPDADFQETLVEAHRQLSVVAEGAAARLMGAPCDTQEAQDERLCSDLLSDVSELGRSMRDYLATEEDATPTTNGRPGRPGHEGRSAVRRPHTPVVDTARRGLVETTQNLADECRTKRRSLAVVLFALGNEDPEAAERFRRWSLAEFPIEEAAEFVWAPLGGARLAVITPGLDRRDAVKHWTGVVDQYSADHTRIDAGIAGVSVLSKGFDAENLLDSAQRCLTAAADAGVPTVKSIEVY